MMRQKQQRIVVVTRETRMEGLLHRWATKGQTKFAFKQARARSAANAGNLELAVAVQSSDEDDDFMDIESEDTTYQQAVKQLTRELDVGLPVQVIDRQYLPSIDFEMCSVVVVIGQDGLVANVAKYVGDVPIIGVNPDPGRFDGVLLPFQLHNVRSTVLRVLNHQSRLQDVTLAEATLHDGQKMLAFNDFFIGAHTHVSARYELQIGNESEEQSSSGVLVATGAGSTGWISSVLNMTKGVADFFVSPIDGQASMQMQRNDPRLTWVVREPFQSQTSGIQHVCGTIEKPDELILESRMSSGGVIFSDGIEADFLDFNGGAIVRIGVADQRAQLVMPNR